MKFLVCLSLVLSAFIASALPESTEMVKYIGMSKYQPEFSDIYDELLSLYHPSYPNYNYVGPHILEYQNAKFNFDASKRLISIKFLREMPFGFREGMSKKRAEKKIKKLQKKKSKSKKSGYRFEYDLDYKRLNSLTVYITSARSDRMYGKHIYEGLIFYDPNKLEKYIGHTKGVCFAYLDKVNGSCESGNCDDGKGTMVWTSSTLQAPFRFSGMFVKGEPYRGTLTLNTKWNGELTLENVFIKDGFLSGITEIRNKDGLLGKVSLTDGNITEAYNFDKGSFVYSGEMDNYFNIVFSSYQTTYLHYKNGYIASIRIDKQGNLKGDIDYENGFKYEGGFNYGGQRHGWGTITDSNLDGKWYTYFTNDVPEMKYRWTYPDGTVRTGEFNEQTGFNGEVTTYYTNVYSVYRVTGQFANHKPTGIHTLVEETTNNTIGQGQYLKGLFVSGTDVYSGPKNSLVHAMADEVRMFDEFLKAAKDVEGRYKNYGYKVSFHINKHYKKNGIYGLWLVNQENLTINFAVYDPYSEADEYVVEANITGYANNNYKYPNIILKRTEPGSPLYYGEQSIATKSYYNLNLQVRAVGAKKDRYNIALYHLTK